jgi:sulfonate dioxygenase
MSPPNTDAIIQEIEKINLQSVAREKGHYLVYPDAKVNYLQCCFNTLLLL